jgi:uncharacterized protein
VIHFLDSSALVKRYVDEPGTTDIAALFRGKRDLAASRLAAVEVPSALARRAREGDLATADARRNARQMATDLASFRLVELRPLVVDLGAALTWRHPLRAYDAVQLASALRLKSATGLAVTFWCADKVLRDAARAEGLRIHRV